MQKVYLLLRNNRQSGPFDLNELIELQLKGDDLIWVEGRSAGWRFPAEIDTLKPFIKGSLPTEVKKNSAPSPSPESISNRSVSRRIYVSLPPGLPATPATAASTSLEEKAEALRQRIQSYSSGVPQTEDEVATNYACSLNDMEHAYTSWVYQKNLKKKKQARKKRLLAIGASVVSIALTWWFFSAPSSPTMVMTMPTVPAPVVSTKAPQSKQEPLVTEEQLPVVQQKETTYKTSEKKRNKNNKVVFEKLSIPVTEPEVEELKPPTLEPPVVKEEKETPAEMTPSEPKKPLKSFFNKLFSKKKKKEEAKAKGKDGEKDSVVLY